MRGNNAETFCDRTVDSALTIFVIVASAKPTINLVSHSQFLKWGVEKHDLIGIAIFHDR